MNNLRSSDLLQFAATLAKDYRDAVVAGSTEYVTSVVVTETVLGPSGRRVPCGEASYPRCHADQFKAGELTISSMDDGHDVRVYPKGTWTHCSAYGPDGHVAYAWEGAL